jgi:inosine/xanthosine triphosphate pyrophosphatase family protein
MPEWVGPTPENPLGGGYNPIFILQGHTRTLAEISAVEGVVIGYREPNFCALIKFLTAREKR